MANKCSYPGCDNKVDNDGEMCEECLECSGSMSNSELASHFPAGSDERALLNDMDDEVNPVPDGFDSAEEHDAYIDSLVNEGNQNDDNDDDYELCSNCNTYPANTLTGKCALCEER